MQLKVLALENIFYLNVPLHTLFEVQTEETRINLLLILFTDANSLGIRENSQLFLGVESRFLLHMQQRNPYLTQRTPQLKQPWGCPDWDLV